VSKTFNIAGKQVTLRYFADPMQSSPLIYHPDHYKVMEESEHKHVKVIAKRMRSDDKAISDAAYKEVSDMGSLRDIVFVIADSFEPIPAATLSNKKKIDSFFKKKNIIIGPECYFGGEYLDGSGTWRDGLDIFGNKVVSPDLKFLVENQIHFPDGDVFLARHFRASNDDIGIHEDITIAERGAKSLILEMIEDAGGAAYCDFPRGINYDPDDEEGNNPLFVKDIRDNDAIKEVIEKWINENLAADLESDNEDGDTRVVKVEENDGYGVRHNLFLSFEIEK